ncbi:uncharacterized protein LOC124292387 isoform X1 [Haliotis rubra]|uniref:uncharacterized protein LOC124292387 isoform X1 n=1 Tax=Haliotis rubra TaxID=36100 RepID=UPI001EE62F1E|nr:uncharacterized protein LOC124292387 isoform X1 [Haliotis rubra]
MFWYLRAAMFAVATLVALLLHGASGTTEFAHGAVTPGNGEVIPMDIELHDNSMITYPGTPDPPQKCFKKSINYHDFTKGLVAMKITEKNTCFVKPSDETYDDIKKVVDNIEKGEKAPKVQATEEWVVPKTPLPAEEIEQKVGKRIAKFCSGCKVHLLQDGKVIRAAADVPRVTAKRGGKFSTSSVSNIEKNTKIHIKFKFQDNDL